MERDTPATFAPAARKASVTKLPRPPFAPVMRVTLPSSSFIYSPGQAGRPVLLSRRPRHAELGIQRQPTAREDRLSRDVRCFIRSQEREDGGDLTRVGGATHRYVALHFAPSLRVVDPGLVDWRYHCSRSYSIHADALAGVFQRQRLCQVLHAALADGI